MYNYSILNLDVDHLEEICQDIAEQYKNGAYNMALFNMTLTPEGNPPTDKVGAFCKQYDKFRIRLAEMGLECGILVQSTIGHGYKLDPNFPFQRTVGRCTGETRDIYCPYDEDFREHFKYVMKTLAEHKPKVIMVDDDFRLMQNPGRGCACPLHMKRFHELSGTNMSREELDAHIKAHPVNDPITDAFIETQRESVVGAAKAMREGIDSVDPTIQGCYCCAGKGAEFAAEISHILAGKNNPSIVRLNNCLYAPVTTKYFSRRLTMASYQIALLKDNVDILISECDSLPHQRFGTSAQFFHSHFLCAVLLGAKGAKHWITKLDSFQPKAGIAYRKILTKHAKMYEKLAELSDNYTPFGCCIPVTKTPQYDLQNDDPWGCYYDGWAYFLLERFGLPLFYSKNPRDAIFMEGLLDSRFSDDEIKEMFKGVLFLSSDSAERLEKRGFANLMGVSVKPWTKGIIKGELFANNDRCGVQRNTKELVPLNDSVVVDSVNYYTNDGGITKTTLAPASTIYKNELGGTVVVFCGTPCAEFNYMSGLFSFLNPVRKAQFTRILEDANILPVYYDGDTETLFQAGYLPDNKILVTFMNSGLDVLEEIPLTLNVDFKNIKRLNPNGEITDCKFKENGKEVVIDVLANPMDPVILIIEQ